MKLNSDTGIKLPDANVDAVIKTQLEHLYPHVEIVGTTGSTNADLLTSDLPDGAVLLAEHQTAARGRLARPWSAPAGTQLILSTLLRVTDAEHLGTLPLAAGLAVTDVIAPAVLKWPNDVLIDGRKLCGILAEAAPDDGGGVKVVIGLGLNHLLTRGQLPVPHATSLALAGIDIPREELAVRVLTALHGRLGQWRAGDPRWLDDYRAVCSSIGRRVRLEAPTGDVDGTVEAIADDGRIVIDDRPYAAGDVTHLRLRGQ